MKNLLKSFGSMCFIEKCSDPSRKTNADVHGNEFYHGKEVQFSCTKDYTLVPASSKKITCQDGDWRGTIPSCKGTVLFFKPKYVMDLQLVKFLLLCCYHC